MYFDIDVFLMHLQLSGPCLVFDMEFAAVQYARSVYQHMICY